VAILYEYVHLGDFKYNGDMCIGEEGSAFELFVTGENQQSPENESTVYQGYLLRKKN